MVREIRGSIKHRYRRIASEINFHRLIVKVLGFMLDCPPSEVIVQLFSHRPAILSPTSLAKKK